jgi:kumamolisin
MESAARVEVPGSEREFDPRHTRIGDADLQEQIEVTVYLRRSASLRWVDWEATLPPADRRTLSREELARGYGASDEDISAVRSFATDNGLEVTGVDPGRRTMSLRGNVSAVAQAFGVPELAMFQDPTAVAYRARRGPLTVPRELGDVITGVFGIDTRPQAVPHVRFHAAPAAATPYTPLQVAAAYNFPAGVDGAGETVAIIELGGGYSQSDLDTYFNGLGLTPPTVTAVGVDGGANSPGVDQGADGEVMLDIEVVGAVAAGAMIVVYFSNASDQGFLDAVSTAVHDTTNNPSVVSISWGGPEDSWSQQARTQMEQILTEAAAVGATVTVASGDSGSTDGVGDGKQHVEFPASAPHALACGGTSLQIAGSQITSETVWNDSSGASGGGISIEFAVPSYQSTIQMPDNVDTGQPGRGVPDVAGDADPATGYSILVDGARQTVGGTSAVAPLWAGLTALINESLGKPVGFLQPLAYAASVQVGFHDITQGNNGDYQAGPAWDPCTGLGSPNGAALLQALRGTPAGAGS